MVASRVAAVAGGNRAYIVAGKAILKGNLNEIQDQVNVYVEAGVRDISISFELLKSWDVHCIWWLCHASERIHLVGGTLSLLSLPEELKSLLDFFREIGRMHCEIGRRCG